VLTTNKSSTPIEIYYHTEFQESEIKIIKKINQIDFRMSIACHNNYENMLQKNFF